jgi:hypothetical protein
MPDEPKAPESFDEMEKDLFPDESPDITPTEPTDADRDSARKEEPKEPKKPDEKPTETKPDELLKKDKATEPKNPKGKDAERLDRNWKRMEEEKAKAAAELAAERAKLKAEREEWEKAKATQSPKNDEPKVTREMVVALAERKRKEADNLRAQGRFAEAEKAEQLAKDADEHAAEMQDKPAPGNAAAPAALKPGTPEFEKARTETLENIIKTRPELAELREPNSPLARATKVALTALPHLADRPEAVASAVAVGEVILDRNRAVQALETTTKERDTLKARVAELEKQLAGPAPGGGAATPPGPKNYAKMDPTEAWKDMEAQIPG